MHHTHVLLCKNFLQGDEEQQQSTKSPSELPSAEDEDSMAAPTVTVINSGANNKTDGETYTNCDSRKYMNTLHSRIAL